MKSTQILSIVSLCILGMLFAGTPRVVAADDEHPTELIADWAGHSSLGHLLFRLRADGTSTVADMRYPNVLCQDGSWRVRDGILFYDMDGDHKSTLYKLEGNKLSIHIDQVVWNLERDSDASQKGCPR
jgi:hypothetical protein